MISCKKLERVNPLDGIAGITTSEVKQVSTSSVQITTNLEKVDGVANITQRGICYSNNPNPNINDLVKYAGSNYGSITSTIEELTAKKNLLL